MSRLLTEDEITTKLADLPDWSLTSSEGATAIAATFELTDFQAAMDFVNQIAHEAEQMDHHPDIDIRWNKVTLVLSTHAKGGVTPLDIELVHRIFEVSGLGAAPQADEGKAEGG
jgi:4a-hydroxytetrahydrobiopterin dehydratase